MAITSYIQVHLQHVENTASQIQIQHETWEGELVGIGGLPCLQAQCLLHCVRKVSLACSLWPLLQTKHDLLCVNFLSTQMLSG